MIWGQPSPLAEVRNELLVSLWSVNFHKGPQTRVNLFRAAEHAFGQRGLVEIAYLTGIYHTVCALLNAFEIPAPR